MGDRALVRPRPVVNVAVVFMLALAPRGFAQEQPAGKSEAPASGEPVDRLPYRIEAYLAIAPDARIDARGRDLLLDGWKGLVRRFVGAPWDLAVAGENDRLPRDDVDAIEPDMLEDLGRDREKLWLFRVERDGPAWRLLGREYDTETRRLGPTYRQPARSINDLPRALLNLCQDVFRPSAVIGEESGGGVTLTVRGASLWASSPFGAVVQKGTVFRPIRLVTLPDGERKILDIPFTYLRVESLDGARARCAIESGLRDPLTRRIAQKNTLVALGSEPGPHPTRLRFLTLPDRAPAAGYRLTARSLPDGPPREVGTTDREGRIVLEPSLPEFKGLVALRLLAGSVEPLVDFPLMPGESDRERALPPVDPRASTVALESQLDSLRDAVIDLVAIRARLEARLKARFDGEDWAGAEAALKEFAKLPPRSAFATKLAELRDDAQRRQATTKTAVLTKTAQAEIAEVDGLIARYLDDEAFLAYTEALAKVRSDEADKAKSKGAPAKAQP